MIKNTAPSGRRGAVVYTLSEFQDALAAVKEPAYGFSEPVHGQADYVVGPVFAEGNLAVASFAYKVKVFINMLAVSAGCKSVTCAALGAFIPGFTRCIGLHLIVVAGGGGGYLKVLAAFLALISGVAGFCAGGFNLFEHLAGGMAAAAGFNGGGGCEHIGAVAAGGYIGQVGECGNILCAKAGLLLGNHTEIGLLGIDCVRYGLAAVGPLTGEGDGAGFVLCAPSEAYIILIKYHAAVFNLGGKAVILKLDGPVVAELVAFSYINLLLAGGALIGIIRIGFAVACYCAHLYKIMLVGTLCAMFKAVKLIHIIKVIILSCVAGGIG